MNQVLVIFYLLWWLVLMGVAIFATQNIGLITVKFINLVSIPVPLGLALISSAGLGAVSLTLWQSQTSASRSAKKPQPAKSYVRQKRYTRVDDDFDDSVDDDWV